jgi:hypothetical protein
MAAADRIEVEKVTILHSHKSGISGGERNQVSTGKERLNCGRAYSPTTLSLNYEGCFVDARRLWTTCTGA